jgi:transposase
LFQWRKAYLEGSLVAVGANETVVPASELQEAMRRLKQLEGALGRKTLENEILKDAVDFAKAKKWIVRSPVLPRQANGQCNGGKLQWKTTPRMFERTLVYELARCRE